MVDELAEVGVAGRNPRILLVVVNALCGILERGRRKRRIVLGVSGSAVMACPRLNSASRDHCAGGNDRNIRPNRPSYSDERVPS